MKRRQFLKIAGGGITLSPWLAQWVNAAEAKTADMGSCSIGYGYLPLPLTPSKTTTAGKDIPTGDQSWTLYPDGTAKEEKAPVAWNSFATPMAADPNTFGYRWDLSVVKQTDSKPGPLVKLFADQPSLLNADLTDQEREALQARAEKLHRSWRKDRDYLAPPALGKLAELDPGLIVTPPPGLEVGYVPIVTRQAAKD